MKFKFSPLHHEDGKPCYFRVSCLALFAVSLVLHVFLKANTQELKNQSNSSAPAAPFTMAQNGVEPASAPIVASSNNFSNVGSAHGKNDGKMTIANNVATQESTVEAQESSWSLFGDSTNAEKFKTLIANRKRALTELTDGVALLASCGNISSSFKNCRFNFSPKVTTNYKTKVVTANNSFTISLEAKGEQLGDVCSKFIVKSNGSIVAIDRQGQPNQRCLIDSINNEQFIALQRSVYSAQTLQGNASNTGASQAMLAETVQNSVAK